jgi:RNA recognition motif-containing protein
MSQSNEKTEKKQLTHDNSLKIFVSRIPSSFDATIVQRLLETHLCDENAVVHVALATDDDSQAGMGSQKEHKGYAFVQLQSTQLVQKALEMQSIKGRAKPNSKRQHTLYLGPCGDTETPKNATSSADADTKSQSICFLWKQNRFPYPNCKFSHEGPGGGKWKKDTIDSKQTKQHKRKCRDYRKGKCQNLNCPFSHDFEIPSPLKKEKSEKDCIDWKTKGKCRKQATTCPYKHDPEVRQARLEKKERQKRQLNEIAADSHSKKQKKLKQPLSVRIFGLNYETQESDVRTLLGQCGPIVKVQFPTFEDSGRSKGYCEVTFQSPKAVAQAVLLDKTELHGRWLSVQGGKMLIDQWEKKL